MRGFLADCRHALRLYARTPGGSLIAVVGFALAMAAVASLVSLYVDLIVRPLPGFEHGGRIVTIVWGDGLEEGGLTNDVIDRIADESTTLEAVAGVSGATFDIGPDRERVRGEMITSDFFDGVRPRLAIGRGFERAEHRADAEPVVVISYRYWREALGGRDDVLGTRIEIHGRNPFAPPPEPNKQNEQTEQDDKVPTQFRIVGVMDSRYTDMQSTRLSDEISLWLPVEQALPMIWGPDRWPNGDKPRTSMRAIGRRSPGASAKAVARELNGRYLDDPLFTELQSAFGAFTFRIDAVDGLVSDVDVQHNAQRQLLAMLGASILLALVAAANVSLFLLARAPGRQRELGIRMAVGAPLKRIARQLASEALLLVMVASVIGIALSVWLTALLRGSALLQRVQWRDVTLLDWRVLCLIGAFVLILAALVSLAPILGVRKLGIAGSSRQISARATVSQRIAGTAQIAVAGMLGGAAVAFGWYLGSMMFGDFGYETRNLYAVWIVGQPQGDTMVDDVRRRDAIMSSPKVTGVSIAGMVPGRNNYQRPVFITHPDDPSRQIPTKITLIDASYVDLLGLRLVHGRSPTDSEVGVVLVNQAFAREYWGREDVVGETLPPGIARQEGLQVIGVLEDLSFSHPAAAAEPMLFITGLTGQSQTALIESTLSSAELSQALQDLVDSGALEGRPAGVTSLKQLRSQMMVDDRVRSLLTVGAAIMVVLLAAFGFYGTQRYLVTAGRREYAIRASLGAGPRMLGRLVLWRGLLLGLPGMAFGLPLAFIAVAFLRDDYVSREVSPFAVTVAVAIGLAALLMAASLGPARQARRTQPAPLLRED